jgi:hypothetical protein
MQQIGRNLTEAKAGLLRGKKCLIHDRDPLFTDEFVSMLAATGIESVKLPPQSPNLNADAERFVRSIKESCLEKMIWFGEDALRQGVQEFITHYLGKRHHQGLENRLIHPEEGHLGAKGEIQQRQRLGGLLNYYYRAAA